LRAAEDVEVLSQGEVEVLSQQFSEVLSPSKPAGKKQKMGDGTSKDQALEITESQE
jgi:hypothetical protein